MSEDKEPTDCGHFVVIHATPKALQVMDADHETHWVPRSQICDEGGLNDESQVDEEGDLFLPQWLAEEKGFA
jgi:hypothetical protein